MCYEVLIQVDVSSNKSFGPKTFGVTGKESRMMREEVKGSSDNQVITPRLGSATAENMPNLSELMSTKSKVIYFIA